MLNIDNLSKILKIRRNIVEDYISMLENTFIIKRIFPFHKNYNKEITKTPKVYFLDLGIRNFLINNFEDVSLRNDSGSLFENLFFIEYLSNDFYSLSKINYWRTTNQTEVDFIINNTKRTYAIECKLSESKNPKSFKTIESYYPDFKTIVINKDNFIDGIEKPTV